METRPQLNIDLNSMMRVARSIPYIGNKGNPSNGSLWLVDVFTFKKERLFYFMSKVAVVYWSGTGNTEAMAMAVAEGAKEKGAEVSVLTASEFSADQVSSFDAIAFGCPSMGAEQLEEMEFEPMFSACENRLSGKTIALFGSYGWGDGEWMRSWESRCNDDGANLACESVICNEAPDDDALAACRELGASLA